MRCLLVSLTAKSGGLRRKAGRGKGKGRDIDYAVAVRSLRGSEQPGSIHHDGL